MRRVMAMKWAPAAAPGPKNIKQDLRPGLLHGWATESDEDLGVVKHIAVAIIEFEGGLVDTWPAHMVRFLDEPEGQK